MNKKGSLRAASDQERCWVVAYDIPDDKRRRKIAKKLEGFGDRVQFSVFECRLSDGEFDRLRKALNRIIESPEDQVRYVPLCKFCEARIEDQGKTLPRSEPGFIVA